MSGKFSGTLNQIYRQHLATIDQVNFTVREIEVISCLWRVRSTKRIALLLNISPKTVDAHIRNIAIKINCTSRENILDFIENSGKLEFIKEFYKNIVPAPSPLKQEESPLSMTEAVLSNLPSSPSVFKQHSPIPKKLKETISKAHFDFTKRKSVFVLTTFGMIFVLILIVFHLSNHQQQEVLSIRSDFFIPIDSILLPRSVLIDQIDKNFKEAEGIQVIALTGIGGAGKTILARQYARSKKFSLVWEIDAETEHSLKESFEALAKTLARTENDKKILKSLDEVKNDEKREKEIKNFVQEKLKTFETWLLIYDNVTYFPIIRKHFPQDLHKWGRGRILLTTRDNNIQNNKDINYIVNVGELNKKEMLSLFFKIRGGKDVQQLSQMEKEDAEQFLAQIPPFPLDISVTAYYLNATKISYNKYSEYINENKKELENAQKDIVNELVNYNKTRHSIVVLSLQRLVNAHPSFSDLLVFISLLDSQKIPKDLLASFSKEIIVDNFIYNLKKYSLIIEDASLHLPFLITFSIHQNIQEIFLDYATNTLGSDQIKLFQQRMSHILEAYIEKVISSEDFSKINFLVEHCEKFLNQNAFLNIEEAAPLLGILGFIYAENGEYLKGKELLENSLKNLKKHYAVNKLKIAKYLMYLGSIYRILGRYEKAEDILEEASFIYRKYFPDHYDHLAQVLIHLGATYKELGKYKKARNILEDTLLGDKNHSFNNKITKAWGLTFLGNIYNSLGEYEKAKQVLLQSTLNYKNYFPENNKDFARALTHLGNAYKGLGFHKKAKDVLERSHAIHHKLFGDNNIRTSWALAHLGNVYKELGDYKQAEQALSKSLEVHQNHFTASHQRIAGLFSGLGSIHLCLGNHSKAKDFLKLSLDIYEKQYGNDHIEVARVLELFGKLAYEEDDVKLAEFYFQRALKIFQEQGHPDSYIVLEDLSDLYIKKFIIERRKGNIQDAAHNKKKAIMYINQTYSTIITSLLKNSPHFTRIQLKRTERTMN